MYDQRYADVTIYAGEGVHAETLHSYQLLLSARSSVLARAMAQARGEEWIPIKTTAATAVEENKHNDEDEKKHADVDADEKTDATATATATGTETTTTDTDKQSNMEMSDATPRHVTNRADEKESEGKHVEDVDEKHREEKHREEKYGK